MSRWASRVHLTIAAVASAMVLLALTAHFVTPWPSIMDKALRSKAVPVHSLFYPQEHEAQLGHENQFELVQLRAS